MKTGYSKVCINPPYGSPISGYYEERFVKGIHDDIYVRATAFDNGETKAVVIALDVICLAQNYYDAFKKIISDETGINKDAIFITCSHTHTGPLVGNDFASEKKSSCAYDEFLISSVRDAAIYALNDLKESKFYVAQSEAKNISFIRRFKMKDGTTATNPGINNPNIDYPLGTPNETVKLLKITREEGKDIYIVNFGTHPDSVGGEYISADYMGYVCSILENAIPNSQCMFLLGFQGDVNHVNIHPTKGESAISKIDFDSVPRSNEHSEHMGRVIAGAVLSICSIAEEIKVDKIKYGIKRVDLPSNQENDKIEEAEKIYNLYHAGRASELPYEEMELTTVVAEAERIIRLKDGPESFPFYVSALGLGELGFVGIGGEPFTEIGNRINNSSPYKFTIICALSNSAGGYIPTKNAYLEGGYEARSSKIKMGGDDIIVEGMSQLLKEL